MWLLLDGGVDLFHDLLFTFLHFTNIVDSTDVLVKRILDYRIEVDSALRLRLQEFVEPIPLRKFSRCDLIHVKSMCLLLNDLKSLLCINCKNIAHKRELRRNESLEGKSIDLFKSLIEWLERIFEKLLDYNVTSSSNASSCRVGDVISAGF